MLVTLLVFLAILGLLVFVHEFGHFLAARWSKVRVEEFAFGFRPRLLSWKRRDTTYAINAIPLGGYVKLYGETDLKESGPDSYLNQPRAVRLKILVAGSLMNLLLGWLIFTVLFAVGFQAIMPGIGNNPFVSDKPVIRIAAVASDSPAERAALQVGDQITALNQTAVATDQEFIALISSLKGQEVKLTVRRGDQRLTKSIIARENPPANQGPLGVTIGATGKAATSILLSPLAAAYQSVTLISLSAQAFIGFLQDLFIRAEVSEEVTGIIGVGALTAVARRLGVDYLAQLIALISIGLSVVNLMPIPPLDGGHLAVLGYERLAGRRISERQLGLITSFGIGLMMIIFLAVTYQDVIRFKVLERLF